MDTRAMSKVKMGYEAIDASSSHQNATMQGGKHKGGDDGEPDRDEGGEAANRESGEDASVQGSRHTNGSKWESGPCKGEEDTTPAQV